jgi:hypothetical protein
MHSAGGVDGFGFGAGVGFDVDGGVDGDGGVYAEDWTEPEGYAGVRIVAQPLPESYWEVVPREALKPGAKGIIPLGPALFVVAEAVLLPTISLADPVARACP